MNRNEADTRAQLIDPALYLRGWTEDLIARERSAQPIVLIGGKARRHGQGRVDYLLRVKPPGASYPVAVAVLEAKAEHLPPDHGLQQGKAYASGERLNVPFVFASNGKLFVEYDRFSGLTFPARSLTQFPSPDELRERYEEGKGFSLSSPQAKPLVTPYTGGDEARRYYQDAAIRATLETLALGGKRALLSLATGTGKTMLAVHLLKRLRDAGSLRKALFICDRDELRNQSHGAFSRIFGADAQKVSGGSAQKNARVLIATYQTLDIAGEDDDANFLTENYPPDYFSHIVIDECHRSAWGKWSQVLTRNPNAVQIGLTATPKQLHITENNSETALDSEIQADNVRYFGDPVYEYSLGQGMADGYLALCQIERRNLEMDDRTFVDGASALTRSDFESKTVTDALTGQPVAIEELREAYAATAFDNKLSLPERVVAMCTDLFESLKATGGPHQKTIIFCASDAHADAVSNCINNLYEAWWDEHAASLPAPPLHAESFAFKCTASVNGAGLIEDFRGRERNYFIAATVDLLSTGVDVPALRNVVFFRYIKSPIAFSQMLGRGTRIDPTTDKLSFRLYDYTNATRLLNDPFLVNPPSKPKEPDTEREPLPPEPLLVAEGFVVQVKDGGSAILVTKDGRAVSMSVEEYRQQIAERLTAEADTLDVFRARWVRPDARKALLERLPDGVFSATLVRMLAKMDAFDLYDVLAEIGYGMAPKTREERADAFGYKQGDWLRGVPANSATLFRAMASVFRSAGTDALESQNLFRMPEIVDAGGVRALSAMGTPSEVIDDVKARLFSA